MRVSYLFFGLLIVGLIVVGAYSTLNSAVSDAGFGTGEIVDPKYETAFEMTENVSAQISSDYDNMMNWTVDKTSFLALIPNAVSMMKNMIKLPFTVIGDLIGSLGEFLYLPAWAVSFLLAIIAGFTVFAVIAVIRGYKWI